MKYNNQERRKQKMKYYRIRRIRDSREHLSDKERNELKNNIETGYLIDNKDGSDDFMIITTDEDMKRTADYFRKSRPELAEEDDERILDEVFGDDWGYSDEWTECSNCGHAINTMHDNLFVDYKEIYCENCVRKEPDNYIKYLINDPQNANTILSDNELMKEGFEKLNAEPFYNEYYDGQNDDPSIILDEMQDKYPNGEFIFSVTGKSNPFITKFDIWGRNLN